MTISVEQVTGPVVVHGEGPVWDTATSRLHWVDMLAGRLMTLDPASGEADGRRVGSVLAAVRPRAGGGLVLALERGFALLDGGDAASSGGAGPEPVALDEVWSDPSIRFNDGGCDRAGRFYCGSMSYQDVDRQPVGKLYRLDSDLTVTLVLDTVSISNGIAWTPDGGTVYYIDTSTQGVDAFDVGPDGAFSNRRRVVTIPEETGAPDGMTLDAEGGLWVAIWNGSAVRRYLPDGTLDAVIELPVPLVTACTFGGPDLRDLYITTSRVDDPDQPGPAGSLYRCRPGVTGIPDTPFAG